MIEHRREIAGVSGWQLITPLLSGLPAEMVETAEKCESPIEQLFACALSLLIFRMPYPFQPTLKTQVPIGRFRVDILLIGHNGAPRIVVECDGKEFHKDVGKDAKRTAEIEAKGYRVVRVTGSEIHHNPISRAKALLEEVGLLKPTQRMT